MEEDKKYESQKVAEVLAQQHVDWFLAILRPLLLQHMVHGFKHGVEFVLETLRNDSKNEPM